MDTQPSVENSTLKSSASSKQLTLAELLLWLLATSAVLGYEQWRLKAAGADDTFRWFFNGRLLYFAPLDGACLASLVVCFWHIERGRRRFPCEPGDWLMIIWGAAYACGAVQTIANSFIGAERVNSVPEWL